MAGRRHQVDSIGESYESFAHSVMSRISAVTRIDSKQDFGTDTYCLPRAPVAGRTETVTELCLLQVKGGGSPLEYGGLDKGEWLKHEIEWLRTLWAPLYLVTVDTKYEQVAVFSTWPIWWVLLQCGTPFEIRCRWNTDAAVSHAFTNPTKIPAKHANDRGDGHSWTVDLGVPILSLSHKDLNDDEFKANAVAVLRQWIRVDRENMARFHARVPLVVVPHGWRANQPPSGEVRLLAWDPRPDANIADLARAFVPSLHALAVHLQWQDNQDVYGFISVLDWVQANGFGNEMVDGLLKGLKGTLAAGVGPGPSKDSVP